jgi:PAS domain-containing protein
MPGLRRALATALARPNVTVDDILRLLGESSSEFLFNRELLTATLEHLSQGVSVVDSDLKLVAWNRRYVELFEYPPSLIRHGQPIEKVFR